MDLRGPTSKGREGMGRGKDGKDRGKEGRERKGMKGKGREGRLGSGREMKKGEERWKGGAAHFSFCASKKNLGLWAPMVRVCKLKRSV